jgi:hypothetical protein
MLHNIVITGGCSGLSSVFNVGYTVSFAPTNACCATTQDKLLPNAMLLELVA